MMRMGLRLVSVNDVGALSAAADDMPNFLTQAEVQRCRAARPPYLQQHLAGLLATKMAVAEILGWEADVAFCCAVEVRCDTMGAPQLHLDSVAAARAMALHLDHWHLSISHTDEYATAVVVAQTAD